MIENIWQEYRKMIICLFLLLVLFALQYATGNDLSEHINGFINLLLALLAGGAVKFSVLKTSERKLLSGEADETEETDGQS